MRRTSIKPAISSLVTVALLASGLTVLQVAPALAAPAAVAKADIWVPPKNASAAKVPASNPPKTALPPIETRSFAVEGEASRAPVGTTVGAPGLGALPYFSFEQFGLSTRTIARVNLANGNLLLTSNDSSLSGPSLGLRNDRFYNGLSSSEGAFGGGWSSSLSELDTRLDVSGTTATFTGPNGFKATFNKPASVWVAPAGFNATLTSSGYTSVLTYNKTGEKLTFDNYSGRLMSDKDRNGVGNTWYYGITGELERVYEASGRYFEVGWCSCISPDRIDTITDSAGRITAYTLDIVGRVERVDGAAGYWEEYDYDSTGRISEARFAGSGGAASKVMFGYDSTHRVTSVSRGAVGSGTYVSVTGFAYTAGQTTVTDGRSNNAVYTIDSSGRATSAKDALLRTRSQTWTSGSDVATSTDAFASGSTPGNTTTYAYDALSNATSVTLPTGAAASAAYATGVTCSGTGGTAYQPKCSSDSAGATKRFDYDANGNITTVTDSTSSGTGVIPTRYTYHGIGGVTCGGFTGQVCTSKDGRNNVTSYAYDVDGNLTSVTPPSPQPATTYTYDAIGRVATVTDGRGDTTTYGYNARDDLTSITFQGGQTFVTTYRDSGLKDTETDSVSGATTYGWDVLGRLTAENPTGTDSLTYAYDANGNLTVYTDFNGTVKYVYDVANQLTQQIVGASVTCPAGTASPAESNCVRFEYDANGIETKRTMPGNSTMVTVNDASGRPTRITGKDTAGVVQVDVGYSYTAAGGSGPTADRTNVQSRTSHLEQGVSAGAITTYGYDSMNRLKTATEKLGSTTTASWAYTYDAAGNRTQQVRAGTTGATAGTVNYVYNAANRISSTSADTTTWTYDGAGNQTRNGITGQTMAYNSRQAVTGINATTYTAFGQGNTQQLSRSGGTTYTNSAAFGLQTEYGSAGTGSIRTYTRTQAGHTVQVRLGASGRYYYVTDHLGSIIGSFDRFGAWQGGISYSPYGETRFSATGTAATTTSLQYAGGYEDSASGMYKLGARYYDPSLGRFTQQDPSGQEGNLYSYASCNPINSADTTGLASQPTYGCWIAYAGAILGTASLIIATFGSGTALAIAGLSYAIAVLGVFDSCF